MDPCSHPELFFFCIIHSESLKWSNHEEVPSLGPKKELELFLDIDSIAVGSLPAVSSQGDPTLPQLLRFAQSHLLLQWCLSTRERRLAAHPKA